MKLPKQDNGKPIKVGDPGFLYKGVFHPIEWRGDEPYRVRGEVLVIRDNKVFLRYYKDSTREYCYRLPGGSLDLDATPIEQARNEVNEEALIDVENLTDTNIQYDEMYPEGFLLKKGDICIAYKGCNTRVYIANYKGRVDKRKIEEHDLDNDMAKYGKFYPINIIYKILRREHIEALLNSSLVREEDKSLLRKSLTDTKEKKIDLNINKLFYVSRYKLSPTLAVRPILDRLNNIFTLANVGNITKNRISLYTDLDSALKCVDTRICTQFYVYTPNYLDIRHIESPTEDHVAATGITQERWYVAPLTFTHIGTVQIESEYPNEVKYKWIEKIDEELISLIESLSIVTEAEDDPEEDTDIEDYGEALDEDGDDTPEEDTDVEDYGDDEDGNDIPEEDDDVEDYGDNDDTDVPEEDDDVSDYNIEDEEGEGGEDTNDENTNTDEDTPPPIEDDDSMDYSEDTPEDGDTPSDETDTESEEDVDDTSEIQDEESSENNNVKNYNLMKDFSRIFYLVSDMMKRIDGLIYAKPIQNSVVAQVSRNLTNIKSSIVQYVKYKFSTNSYTANLYHYNIIIQAIKINVEILNKIQHLDTDDKQIDKK